MNEYNVYIWPVHREDCGCIFKYLSDGSSLLLKACKEHEKAYK